MADRLEREISQLKSDLESARWELYALESKQKEFLENVRSSSTTTLKNAVGELLKLVTYVCKVDSTLITYDRHPKFIKYILKVVTSTKSIDYLVERESREVEKYSTNVELVFETAESSLKSNMEAVMKEEERVSELAVTRIGCIEDKISVTKVEVSNKIRITEREISNSESEKYRAESNKSDLQKKVKDLNTKTSRLERERSDARDRAGASTAVSIIGGALTPFLPFVGIPLLLGGGAFAIGNGVDSANYTSEINSLRNEECEMETTINRLESTLCTLKYTTLPELRKDRDRFDGMEGQVSDLKTKSQDLQTQARSQVRQLTDAKNSLSIAITKISELNAHIVRIGFADTWEELADALNTIVLKLTEGQRKLDYHTTDTNGLSLVNKKIEKIMVKAPKVMAILDGVA